MSTAISFNGVSYSVPSALETDWASLSEYLIALSTGTFQRAGGSFVLTADADFGANFGLKAAYYKSRTANIAAAGIVRFANAEGISWRNAGNSADLALVASASDRLTFGGVNVPTISSTDTLTNKTLTAPTITGAGAIAGVFTGNLTGNVTGNATTATTATTASGVAVGGITGLGSNVATWLATPSSANLRATLTDETGTGAAVFADSPTLVTPALGTPASGTLTSCTGLPISTGVSGLGTGVATWLATPSSANLAAAVTGETGTGALVFATSPALVTPDLGAATATSIVTGAGISSLGTVGGINTQLVSARYVTLGFNSYNAGSYRAGVTGYASMIQADNTAGGGVIYAAAASATGGDATTLTDIGGWTPTGSWGFGPVTGNGVYTSINRLLKLTRTTNYDVNGDLTATQLTASVVTSSYLRLITAGGAFNLDGMIALTDGTVLWVENQSGQTMTVRHNGAGEGTAANQINTSSAGSFTFADGSVAQFIYSAGKGKWLLTNRF